MKRIAILQHSDKQLFVEDVLNKDLAKYPSLEAYVEDNYYFDENYSVSEIEDASYMGLDDKTPIEIDFKEL